MQKTDNNGHPKGLYLLFMTEMAERFSYYGMRALFVLYLVSVFYNDSMSSQIYGSYTGLVYLTPLLGGYVADRYWGKRRSIIFGGLLMAIGQFLMFASACFVQQSIMIEGGVVDASVDNTLSLWLMFAGLAMLIFGNGFFKPNISTMVGDLYSPGDRRKDSAFTIFYMGINVGAFIAPLICGFVGDGNWSDPGRFKWGFFVAGVAMLLSVMLFVLFKDRYLISHDGNPIGVTPMVRVVSNEEKDVEARDNGKNMWRKVVCISLFLVLFLAFGGLSTDFNSIVSAAVYGCSVALPAFIITDSSLTKDEKSRLAVLFVIIVFGIFFWSAYEQTGSSLTLFAEHQCDRSIFGWDMPTPWLQSVNPIVVVVLAPVMAMLWEQLARHGKDLSSIVKQALGLLMVSLGYFFIAMVVSNTDDGMKVSVWWLMLLYMIHTVGELALSPIGLSLVTKLSPVHLSSLLMGVWFMSNAASNIFAGQLASLLPDGSGQEKHFMGIEIVTLSDFFMLFAVMSGIAAVLLFCISPYLRKMMKGVE